MTEETPQNNPLEEMPEVLTPSQPAEVEAAPETTVGGLARFLNLLTDLGIRDQVIRVGGGVIMIALIFSAVVAMRNYYGEIQTTDSIDLRATANAIAAPTLSAITGLTEDEAETVALMPDFDFDADYSSGIAREAQPETVIPNRARVEIQTYDVALGDSVFSIAEKFGLRPETIMWSNYDTLQDNPISLQAGQKLNIMPVDGVYYRYNIGESLDAIATFFRTTPEKIVNYPGNDLDPYETDIDNPAIADGTWLIIPDGERELIDWGPPRITRTNPASASYYGAGSCGQIYEGPVGNGTFIWPTPGTYISGNEYNSVVHPALDIAGAEGNAVWATDAGVVVYAGWSDVGYGYLVVIDHGNGWQSAYAHLSGIGVFCGQGVAQGTTIGAVGNTGNSFGSHLHFEMLSDLYGKVNPWNFLYLP